MNARERLPLPFGIAIDRSRPLGYSFDGRSGRGYAGDTLASALAGDGVWLLSRSFKYHRPRGLFSLAGHDANTLVQVEDEPNVLADRLVLREGLTATPLNGTGTLTRDRARILERLHRFMPVGFYYHAFFRPAGTWPRWEKLIRAMGGLGTVNTRQKHGYYDKAYAFCDVCVIGAGPAGLSAALEAAAAGAEVIIIDDQALPGGALSFAREEVEGGADALRRSLLSQIEAQPSITLWSGAICQGWFTDHWLPVTRGDRLYKVRAAAVVIATGTIGQQVVFRNNDLPGIMLGSAAQRLMRLYGVRPGTRAVILAADEAGYGVALDLIDAGVEVAALLDLRAEVPASPLAAAVRERGVPVRPRMAVAEAVEGRNHLSAVRIAQVVGEGTLGTAGETIACDLLCLSAGGVPNAALVCHAGGSVRHDAASGRFVVASTPPDLFVAGSVAGTETFTAAMAGGRRAGWQAARAAGFSNPHEPQVEPASAAPAGPMPWPIFPHPKGKDFVDFDEDLTVSHVRDAVAAGFDSVELLKRYSTAGMGPSQGRITNPVLYRLLAQATGQSVEAVGSVTVRPPIGQEKIGHLAGRGFDPVRLSPIHHRHQELGATMMVAGTWLRPAVYGEGGQEVSIRDEVRAVRNGVGLIDVSTLGKIEVRGPDAAAFLERIYTFAFAAQPVGRVRYALMTDEVGNVMDDGVAARLHAHHFYVTATTGGADGVYRFMQWCNAQWRLAVDIANVTAAYAAVNIAGPRARAVLARLDGDLDLAPEAFPYMAVREGMLAGMPVRALRVGFVGELGYELHVPSSCGEAIWDRLLAAGQGEGIKPFGVEAQRILRLEKGHVIIGQDTDGLSTPGEAGLGWALSKKKPFFVGKAALELRQRRAMNRVLVGFVQTSTGPQPLENHLIFAGSEVAGRVTSVAFSPSLERVIGLAYVPPALAETGTALTIQGAGGQLIAAEVSKTPFYDPENRRQEM